MRVTRILSAAFVLGAALQSADASTPLSTTMVPFPPGSIILPTTSAYQDDCGAVSVYGLIYDILRAEAWLQTNGYGTIHVNYGLNTLKHSPNRCMPTDKSALPAGSGWTTATANDGCDLELPAANRPGLVNNASASTGLPTPTDGAITTYSTVGTTDISHNEVFPQYAAISLSVAGTTQIGYMGGAFYISSRSDGTIYGNEAATFAHLLDGTLIAHDSTTAVIDFSPFRTKGTVVAGNPNGCHFGYNTGTSQGPANEHWVNVHRTTGSADWSAPVVFALTSKPPRLAVLETDHGNGTGNVKSSGFDPDMLIDYLADGGIDFNGAQGCPTAGSNIGNSTLCPHAGSAGQIFDRFDLTDLADPAWLSATSGSAAKYSVVWTPHWTQSGTFATSAMSNLRTSLNNNSSTGLMGECSAIDSYEGNATNQLQTTGSTTANNSDQAVTQGNAGTCYQNPNIRLGGSTNNSCSMQNCTDPSATAGVPCVQFPNPGDQYVQVGDYLWNTGSTGSPVTGYVGTWKPGVTLLVSQYSDKSQATPQRFEASRALKDNDPTRGTVLYIGGHDQSQGVAGTKMVLQTLLFLGTTTVAPTTNTTETSRSTPIVASVAGGTNNALVVGSYENVQLSNGSGSPAPPALNGSADFSGWTFPYIKGHLRAKTIASLTAGSSVGLGSGAGSGTTLFDVADHIPTATFAGCGATAYHGTCRTVFTNSSTGTGSGSAGTLEYVGSDGIVQFNSANANAIGAQMETFTGSTLTAASYPTLVQRVLAGSSNGSGSYTPGLGGIDRSTVAVIGPSTAAPGGANRPTVAYVGADDGMLHAFCASQDTGSGAYCNTAGLGAELWAFMPRTELPWVHSNQTKIDGSPHVVDAFGDFTNGGTGAKGFHTILLFQTGAGDPSTWTGADHEAQPAVYALDVTNPYAPRVVWEYTLPSFGGTRGTDGVGVGLTIAAGVINLAGVQKNLVFAQTTDGGTNGASAANAGMEIIALDMQTGIPVWTFAKKYPDPPVAPRITTDSPVPCCSATGKPGAVPGGVVPVDKTGQGFVTHIVAGDLYGRLWELDANTGLSVFGSGSGSGSATELFSFTTNYRPIGAMPAVYSSGGKQFAAFVSGGYVDLNDTPTWGFGTGIHQMAVAVALSPTGVPPLHETTVNADVPLAFPFTNANEAGFSQALVLGGQLLFTTDTTDVNAQGYGTTGANTGHVYAFNLGGTTPTSTVVIAGGASSVVNSDSNTVYAASANQEQKLPTGTATTSNGTSVDTFSTSHLLRMLWLRTE